VACCITKCNSCGWEGRNVFLPRCPSCASTNVDKEHDVEYDFGHIQGPFDDTESDEEE